MNWIPPPPGPCDVSRGFGMMMLVDDSSKDRSGGRSGGGVFTATEHSFGDGTRQLVLPLWRNIS